MIDKMFKVSVLILLASTALCAYWLWFDNPVIVSNVRTHVVNTKPLHPGDDLILERAFCQSREAIPESGVRTIENGYIYPLSNHHVSSEPGCYDARTFIAATIPPGILPGEHHYKFELGYRVNPLKTVIVRLPDIAFTVVPAPIPKGPKGDRGPPGVPGDGNHYTIFGK